MAHEKDEAEDLESRKQILPDAPGETLITAAVKFLQNAKVRESSLSQRKLFLEKKGLSKEQIDIAVTRSEQEAALQPQYVKPHLETTHQCCSPVPVSAVSKVRDYVGFTLVVGGVGYAIYYLLRRFLGEVLFGPSEEQKQMTAVTKSVTQLEESITEMLRGLRDMQGQLQQQQLNLTQIITNMGSPEVARIQDTRDLNEVKEAVNSLKGLLLNRKQFPPTPVTAPVLPAWQLSKGDIASESSSSAISITTNVSTTSDSTAQDTDSTEDVTLCKDDKVVQNAKTESDLLVENSNNEKLSSTTNGIKETASDELLET